MALVLCTNLAAYVAGAEEIIVSLIPMPPIVAELIFYAAAASVVLFGLKAVGISEKIAVTVIFVLIGMLAVASFFAKLHPVNVGGTTLNTGLAYFGMHLFVRFAGLFKIPAR